MKKIIFINRYFFPDHSATSQMLTDLAFGLEGKINNKEIHVVASRQLYGNSIANLPPYQTINGVNIHRVYSSCFGRTNLIGRALDYLSFYFFSVFKLIKLTHKGDTLIAKTDPPLISVIAMIVAILKKAYLINWLQDLFPEVAAQLGVKLVNGKKYNFLKAIRNKTLHYARMNVVIGHLMAKKLIREGVCEKKIIIIHNWADGELIKPISHDNNQLRKEWGLEGKFVVGYSGNLGRSHDFLSILLAAEELKLNKEIVFLFIGDGAQLPNVKKTCKEKNLNNVYFKNYQPREKLDESLSLSDVHLISLKPELEGLIVPSKFYGILAAGKPVIFIGDSMGELSAIIKTKNCGQVVSQGNMQELVSAINKQYQLAKDSYLDFFIRQLFDSQYSKLNALKKFIGVLNEN